MHQPGMPITVDIGGQDYEIRFSLRTLKALQKDHGISLLKGLGDMMDPERLAAVLFYGLRDKNPEMTLEWVEDNVDTGVMMRMIPALSQAISGQTPKQSEPPNEPPPSLVSGTGSPSGPLDATTSVLVNGRSGA